MGFKQLITKVSQAELALEEKERIAGAHWHQLKATWLDAWTPGRIVIAGLASGFVIGRAQPFKTAARSGQVMQLVTMLSGLFAGGTAKVAAEEAEHAAETAENVADAVAPEAAVAHDAARGGPMAGTRVAAQPASRPADAPPPVRPGPHPGGP
jgi:hypothetical protein